MTITEQEDFNIGKYGYQVTLEALRSNKDTVFFAGPGGRLGTDSMSPKEERRCPRSSRRRHLSGNSSMLLSRLCMNANTAGPYWSYRLLVPIGKTNKRMLDLMNMPLAQDVKLRELKFVLRLSAAGW